MRVSLNLPQQGFVLVGVPTGLLLILLICVLGLFFKLEQEAKESEMSKKIISKANSLVKEYYDCCSQLIIFKHSKEEKDQQVFDAKLKGTEESFSELKDMLKSKEQLKELAELRAKANIGMSLMRRYEAHLARVDRLNELEVGALYAQFDKSGAKFAEELQDFINKETERHKVFSAEEEKTRLLFKCFVIAGMCVAAALGLTLLSAFSRNTISRLDILMENTFRLGHKQPLLPIVTGEDEISRLDLFFHKMARDLDEAKRKETAILSNAVDVICSIDADGKFVAANPATLKTWGYTEEELAGKHFSELLSREDGLKFEEAIEHSRQSKELVNLENKVATKYGDAVHMLWSLRWSDEEQSAFCVAHDISDRIAVEKLKQEFVAVVSHELRTPLSSLQMLLTLLREGAYGDLTPTGEKRIEGAEYGVTRLIALINDLLDIEKMEAGKLSMSFSDVDLGDIAENSVEAIRGFAVQHGVTVTTKAESVKVLADKDRLVQVMVNLLSNAIKYSDDNGNVELVLVKQKDTCEVQIIDHGPGIPEGYEKVIFEKYEQAKDKDGKKRKGTGLGLAICKAIVEQHGGTIGVRGTEGGGSTFWFQVPHTSATVISDPQVNPAVQPQPSSQG